MMDAIAELIVKGGAVMYPLLAASCLSLSLVAERSYFWLRISRRQGRLVRLILSNYGPSPDIARKHLEESLDLPIARIFLAAIALDHPNPEEFRLALESAAQAEIPVLKRFVTLFDSIITLAPLLGLLGTVTGLMVSFASIQFGDFSGERAAQVSAGISEALITTAVGLAIAIFTSFFANLFRGFYQRQFYLIQEYGGQLELTFRRCHYRGA